MLGLEWSSSDKKVEISAESRAWVEIFEGDKTGLFGLYLAELRSSWTCYEE